MAEVTIEQRFHGTAILTILHLRRLAKSNDIDEGFAAARSLHMIDEGRESFMRRCLALDAAIQSGAAVDEAPTMQLVNELQACVLCINSADPA